MFLYSRKLFPVAHWLTTLLIGPIILFIWSLSFYPGAGFGELQLLPIYLLFSLFFSFPALVLYFFTVQILAGIVVNEIFLKVVLDFIVVVAIAVTMYLIDGSMAMDFFLAYSVATIIGSIILGFKSNI